MCVCLVVNLKATNEQKLELEHEEKSKIQASAKVGTKITQKVNTIIASTLIYTLTSSSKNLTI